MIILAFIALNIDYINMCSSGVANLKELAEHNLGLPIWLYWQWSLLHTYVHAWITTIMGDDPAGHLQNASVVTIQYSEASRPFHSAR